MQTNAARNAAFERTYAEYRGLMLALAKRILGDADLAEDAVSDASVKLLEHYDCLEEPVSPRTRRSVSTATKRRVRGLTGSSRQSQCSSSLTQASETASSARAASPRMRLARASIRPRYSA